MLRALFSGFQLLIWVRIWYAVFVFDYFKKILPIPADQIAIHGTNCPGKFTSFAVG